MAMIHPPASTLGNDARCRGQSPSPLKALIGSSNTTDHGAYSRLPSCSSWCCQRVFPHVFQASLKQNQRQHSDQRVNMDLPQSRGIHASDASILFPAYVLLAESFAVHNLSASPRQCQRILPLRPPDEVAASRRLSAELPQRPHPPIVRLLRFPTWQERVGPRAPRIGLS